MQKKTLSTKDRTSDNTRSYDFIPIACHYDKHTAITKNGELFQTIKIHGTYSQVVRDNIVNLRSIIRDAIRKNVKSDHFAFWIHTISRKKNLDDSSPYPNIFSANLHNIWRDKNYWHDKFVNTLYISIVYHKPDIKISSLDAFMNSLSFNILEQFHIKAFENMASVLNNTVESIVNDLKDFGVHRLGIIEYGENDMHSEIVFFLRSIVNLNASPMPIPIKDYSFSLSTHNYVIGNNQMQVRDPHGLTFASILSLKEYHEISEEYMEELTRLPVEFIATEVFYFSTKAESIKDLVYTDYILGVSDSKDMLDYTGIKDMMTASENPTEFCKHQINIMLMNSDTHALESSVLVFSKNLSSKGIMHVIEDINLEQTFWSQMPGNFSFLRRIEPVLSNKIASFASLHNFPSGDAKGFWGNAITILRTEKGSPYFMNFHDTRNIGHGCIFSFPESGKTVLMNFLISEVLKLLPTMVYITTNNKSRIFLDAIECPYKDFDINSISKGSNIAFDFSDLDTQKFYDSISEIVEYLSKMDNTLPKILVIDDISNMLAIEDFVIKFPKLLHSLSDNNGIMLFSINIDQYSKLENVEEINTLLDTELGYSMIIPGSNKNKIDLGVCLNLTKIEESKLASINIISRLFLMKQNNKTRALEISLGGIPGILKMLSASDKDIAIYEKIRSESGKNWIVDLYNIFSGSRSY